MAQLVAPLVSVHVVGLPDPYGLLYEPASFVGLSINHVNVLPVHHMIHTATVISDLLQILAAVVFSALVNIPVQLSTSLHCSFAPSRPVAFDPVSST